jgi:hypothetical protein
MTVTGVVLSSIGVPFGVAALCATALTVGGVGVAEVATMGSEPAAGAEIEVAIHVVLHTAAAQRTQQLR